MGGDVRIAEVAGGADLDVVRALFREYEAWLGVDLCFQGFEQELAALPGTYAPPGGRLLLARLDGEPAGCVALRAFGEDGRCEMKRLWVRPTVRGQALGRRLVERLITQARGLGYRTMLLDTLPKMAHAFALYSSVGFIPIPRYYDSPIPDAIYLALRLTPYDDADLAGARVEAVAQPGPTDFRLLEDALAGYNIARTRDLSWTPLVFFLRDAEGRMVGGVRGAVWGRAVHVMLLWVAEPFRGRGYGTALLDAIENAGRQRGARIAWLDSFSYQAPLFYLKRGYDQFAVNPDVPAGHSQHFFRKRLL